MNTYNAYYKGQEREVQAETSYRAQCKASVLFQARNTYDITVVLVEKGGEPVYHNPGDICS